MASAEMFVKLPKLAQLLYSTKQLLFCLHACPFKKSPQEHHFPQNIGIMRRPMCIPGNPFCLEHTQCPCFCILLSFPSYSFICVIVQSLYCDKLLQLLCFLFPFVLYNVYILQDVLFNFPRSFYVH